VELYYCMNTKLQDHTLAFLKSRNQLLAYLRSLSGNAHVAEEMLQEVWLKLSEAIDKNTEIIDTQNWCRGVARNLMKHHWREKAKLNNVPDDELLNLIDKAYQENSTDNDQYSDFIDALRACLQNLPLKARKLLDYKYKENLKFDEISIKLDENKNALMMRVSRLRTVLQDCIQKRISRT
jgi:RNA polymerase sigma-70 factor, ECF subfamily